MLKINKNITLNGDVHIENTTVAQLEEIIKEDEGPKNENEEES